MGIKSRDSEKSRSPGKKIPRLKKSRKKPDGPKTVKAQNSHILKVFFEVLLFRSRSPGFVVFGIFRSRCFRNFQIPIPIPGISGFSGFCDLAKLKKSKKRIPGIRIWESESRKNPIPMTKYELYYKL